MAIGLPTSSLVLSPQNFRRGKSIKSGEAAADLSTGTLREITQEINFALAYKTRTIGGFSKWADPGTLGTGEEWFADETSLAEVTPYLVFQLGADVAKIEVIAEVKDAELDFQTDQGNPTGTIEDATGARVLLSKEYTIATPGAILQLRVKLGPASGKTTGYIYGYQIREVYMVSGDFP